ncbi:hypothetical protein CCUG63695_03055 [Mycobacteroides franklinii]|uniref:Uncharacterized protein n=2 Tax=Mycobacteroides franklinii TaxID=948102 RepID=A0A4R8R264_9MYCO|nr:hypothetical protein CCUG64054_03128 [Mycobacteroides franklinii]TDZ50211.1 hypothetical protein CCUG63697_01713 [Mycobacteroides franklinii]TDZ56632.1 hypothetical protein CCUG63696_03130 [Mycobacteroides franklinii]TDZ63573.1 hypothetical protein CCUG63695_03055 [Mycobacteroides franklinii]TDZ69970.1 hypothetical protein CCUG64056_03128 [Mycobacteroides franklinii]
MPAGLRRVSALVAIVALAVGGAKIVDDNTLPGSGFSAVATVAADPTGPPGPTGGMTDGGGSQFQPPQMPSSMPDYQGGNNQPPMDQNSGISIYNSGAPQAGQQAPQQGGQQPQQAQQPAHGTQIPDYQNATQYTQGPGKPNPDYQAPQQQSPQQGQQPQQQQPSQAPTQTQQPQQPQNKQDQDTQQLDQEQQREQQCQLMAQAFDVPSTALDAVPSGSPPRLGGPSRSWSKEPGPGGTGGCSNCPQPQAKKDPLRDYEHHWWGIETKLRNQEAMVREMDQLSDAVNLMGLCAAGATVAGATGVGTPVAVTAGAGCAAAAAYFQHLKDTIERTMRTGSCMVINTTWLLVYKSEAVPCG